MALSGIWISPVDHKDKVLSEAKALMVLDNVLFIETNQIRGISEEKLKSIWGFEDIRSRFEEFIKKVELLMKDELKRKNGFEIKKLIFEYALILNSQPQVPIEFVPKDWPEFRAKMNYKGLKRLLG